jgi:6-phosphogluconolactonase (cycloisomerase 2 family)
MAARALVVAVFSLLIGLFSPASSEAQRTLTVIDNSPFPEGPGDVDFVPGTNDVVTMSFNSGEAVIHRVGRDGTLREVGRSPVGPEPRAMAFAHGGELAVIANSIANELGVFEVGDDGLLREINRVPSGGLNPYDVAVAFDEVVVVANRDSNEIRTFRVNRRAEMIIVDSAPTGNFPHVVAVSRRDGLLAVANQTDRTVSLFELNRRGELTSTGTIPLDNMTPRTLVWQGRRLFVAVDAPSPSEDVIRAFYVDRRGQIEQRGDTPAGAFLTDLEARSDTLFAVTVNRNNLADPTDDRDEVRAYSIDETELTLEAAVQTPGAPPSFKQITARRGRGGIFHVLTTEFQGGWLRSLIYDEDEP